MLARLATLSTATAFLYGWTASNASLLASSVALLIIVASHLWHD